MRRIVYGLLLSAAMSGCTRSFEDLYVGPTESNTSNALKDITEYFDFNTTHEVNVAVNYGKTNGRVLLQFYDECPLVMDEETQSYSIEGTPIYSIFTDDNGLFNGTVQLPTNLDRIFVYSPYWGTPTIVEAEIKNNQLVVNTAGVARRNLPKTRVAETLSSKEYKNGFYTLVDWDQYGTVSDPNGIFGEGPFSGAFINGIRRALWNGKDVKPNGLDNSAYTAATSKTNTSVLATVTDDNGVVQTVESAVLTLNFLFEAGWFESSLGYYYYKTDECPSTADAVKKFIIVPNVSIAYNAPYGVNGYDNYDAGLAPMQTNTSITLLYEDADGQLTPNFPPGYTVGYFLVSNGFNSKNGDIQLTGKVHNKNVNIFYSNNEWNASQTKRFISASAPDGTIIYGVEDGEDKSYDDAVFTISSSPNIAIKQPDRKPLNPTEFQLTYFDDVQRTYAYEDIWPTGGDYDMNDVVIQHRSEVEMDNQNNVYTVKDHFTPVQLKGSAQYHNAFAIQFGSQTGNSRTFPEGSIWEESTGSLILFASANNSAGKTFTVVRDFKGFITKKQLNTDEKSLNPFIIVKYQPGESDRIEVHLPKMSATSRADQSLISSQDDAYYIDKDGQHPFAISVPGIAYIPANEGVEIDNHYPMFTEWVNSNGTKNQDWWKYPVK
jgi:hypothetical protein